MCTTVETVTHSRNILSLMTVHFLLVLVLCSCPSLHLSAHSEQLGINLKAATNRNDMVGKTLVHVNGKAAHPPITRVGLTPRAAEKSADDSRAKHLQHTHSEKKYKIVFKSQKPSHLRFLRNERFNNSSREKLQTNLSSTMISKRKKSFEEASRMSVSNVPDDIKEIKTRILRNSLKTRLLENVLRLEHRKRFSTKSSIFGKLKFKVSGVKLAELAKRYEQYTTNNVKQTNNSWNETNKPELQILELKKILDKLQRLVDNKNVLTEKETTEKQRKFPSLLTGELDIKIFEGDAKKLLGKIHLAKKSHKYSQFKKVGGLRKDGNRVDVSHSRSGESTKNSGSGINVAGAVTHNEPANTLRRLPPNVMDVPSLSSVDNPLPSPLLSRANANQEMTLDTVNRFSPAVTGLGQMSSFNQQKPSGVDKLNIGQGFGSKLAADELVYGAAQLEQQQNLGALETEQREGIQGRLGMLTNRRPISPNQRRYPNPVRYRSFMGQYPTFGGFGRAPYVNPGLSYEALFSMNKFPSWRTPSALPNYPSYTYPLFSRRSFYPRMRQNFSPWSYLEGRYYGRPYGRFSKEEDWNGYPDGDSYETSPRNVYDDDDFEGLRSRNYDYSDYSEDGGDEDTAEERDRGYRRMGISRSSKSSLKKLKERMKKTHQFSKSAIKHKSSNTRTKSVMNRLTKAKTLSKV